MSSLIFNLVSPKRGFLMSLSNYFKKHHSIFVLCVLFCSAGFAEGVNKNWRINPYATLPDWWVNRLSGAQFSPSSLKGSYFEGSFSIPYSYGGGGTTIRPCEDIRPGNLSIFSSDFADFEVASGMPAAHRGKLQILTHGCGGGKTPGKNLGMLIGFPMNSPEINAREAARVIQVLEPSPTNVPVYACDQASVRPNNRTAAQALQAELPESYHIYSTQKPGSIFAHFKQGRNNFFTNADGTVLQMRRVGKPWQFSSAGDCARIPVPKGSVFESLGRPGPQLILAACDFGITTDRTSKYNAIAMWKKAAFTGEMNMPPGPNNIYGGMSRSQIRALAALKLKQLSGENMTAEAAEAEALNWRKGVLGRGVVWLFDYNNSIRKFYGLYF